MYQLRDDRGQCTIITIMRAPLTVPLQAVGPKNYDEYFSVIDWALKPGRGTVVISSTTQPEHRYTEMQ